ncbi:MAG: hypothetical protein WB716_12185, partial [Candidatus Acidiferrales bacterium]
GLIVTTMGATTGIFGQSEIAVMVAVVLITTLITPIALRGAFHLKSEQDREEGLADSESKVTPISRNASFSAGSEPRGGAPHDSTSFRVMTPRAASPLGLSADKFASDVK